MIKRNQLIFLYYFLGMKAARWRGWVRKQTGNSFWFHCQALKSHRSAINLRKSAVNVCNKFVITLWTSPRSRGLTVWQVTFSMIFSITCILERLRKSIICVPGDENIKNPQSDRNIQAGFLSAPGLAKQTVYRSYKTRSPGTGNNARPRRMPPLTLCLMTAQLRLCDVARAHWLSVKNGQIELLVITAGKWLSQYFLKVQPSACRHEVQSPQVARWFTPCPGFWTLPPAGSYSCLLGSL